MTSPPDIRPGERPASRGHSPHDGLFHLGRPEWMTDVLLTALRAEAERLRGDAVLIDTQRHHAIGPVATELANGPLLRGLVERTAVPVRERSRSNYLYYQGAGAGIGPHIDEPDFAVSALILLSQTGPRQRSRFMLFPTGPNCPVRVDQRPGDITVFWASEVVHARRSTAEGEYVVNLGIGMQPAAPMGTPSFWRPGTSADRSTAHSTDRPPGPTGRTG